MNSIEFWFTLPLKKYLKPAIKSKEIFPWPIATLSKILKITEQKFRRGLERNYHWQEVEKKALVKIKLLAIITWKAFINFSKSIAVCIMKFNVSILYPLQKKWNIGWKCVVPHRGWRIWNFKGERKYYNNIYSVTLWVYYFSSTLFPQMTIFMHFNLLQIYCRRVFRTLSNASSH